VSSLVEKSVDALSLTFDLETTPSMRAFTLLNLNSYSRLVDIQFIAVFFDLNPKQKTIEI
jgi:hypothetical protein